MSSFIVRGVDTALWTRLRERARVESRTVTDLLESLIRRKLDRCSFCAQVLTPQERACSLCGWKRD